MKRVAECDRCEAETNHSVSLSSIDGCERFLICDVCRAVVELISKKEILKRQKAERRDSTW